MLSNNGCIDGCPAGTFNNSGVCVDCINNCSTCKTATICLSCISSATVFYLAGSTEGEGTCIDVSSCPIGNINCFHYIIY